MEYVVTGDPLREHVGWLSKCRAIVRYDKKASIILNKNTKNLGKKLCRMEEAAIYQQIRSKDEDGLFKIS